LTQNPRLEQQARVLRDQLTKCLNGSITDGIRLTVIEGYEEKRVITYRAPASESQGIPLTLGAKPRFYLELWCALYLDERETLSVHQSKFGLYLDSDLTECWFRYEYELDNAPYPDAHFHVHLKDHDSRELPEGREFYHLHFPVGSKRYRPCLEDVVTFLITEGFVEARTGWEDVVEAGRNEFWRTQLAGAMRENLEMAREVLARVDRADRTRYESVGTPTVPWVEKS
jgi:hypothetical protein